MFRALPKRRRKGYQGRSPWLVRLGHAQAGLEHVLYAMQLSPQDPILGYWLAFAGYGALELARYDEAIDYLSRAHESNPSQPRTALTYIAALAMAGRMSEARSKIDRLQKEHPHLTRDRLLRVYSRKEVGMVKTSEGMLRVLGPNESPPGARSDGAR
jgi:tetratricopeptide (TPR) repeat protein